MSGDGKSKYTFGDLKRKFSPTWVEVAPSEKAAMKFVLTEAVPEAFDFRRGANLTTIAMASAEGAQTDLDTVVTVGQRLIEAINKKMKEWES
jgi:hypothetical protein